ncbi:hypothetical protein EDB81DRAFT_441557 [Dactylonectria macrodidyma]|uniref:SET domain-containing protein n=1 Tax=Dactylonectria macrodidyma TaxID=307937 RepID=A0A9P9F3L6_9HYPO|nr:hypothetical protein EDB81DRAFT_441557 [Dactylonectria macrodidyma]
MESQPNAASHPNMDPQLDDPMSSHSETTTTKSHTGTLTDNQNTMPKCDTNPPTGSHTEKPLLCKDVLHMLHHWCSSDSIAVEDVCTSESEHDLTSESDAWSDDDDDDGTNSDESVLCLTSRGPRPLDSSDSLRPPLPRRLSFKPLETTEEKKSHESATGQSYERDFEKKDIIQHPVVPKPEWPQNVIFQNQYFSVAESKIAGWGAFAIKDLKYGDTILVEKPLFTADSSTLFHEFDKLDQDKQEIALALHANDMCKPGTPKVQAIWTTNCFATGLRDKAGLFPIASRFNHSCHPKDNIEYTYDHRQKYLEMIVKAETIAAGEELTISYGNQRTPIDLFLRYGFRCRCGACPGLVDSTHMVEW